MKVKLKAVDGRGTKAAKSLTEIANQGALVGGWPSSAWPRPTVKEDTKQK